MAVGESAREYIAGVKGNANAVRYNDVEEEDEEIYCHISSGLPTYYDFLRKGFAIQDKLSLKSLEHGLVNAEGINKHFDGADGSHTLAACFNLRGGEQGGLGGGCDGRYGR